MQLPLNFVVQPRLFAFLVIGFVLTTIVGTVSHEIGHYLPAKYFGEKPRLHYAMVSFAPTVEDEQMELFYEQNKVKILAAEISPEKSKFSTWLKDQQKEGFITTLGGPLQTMLTGTIGFLILWFNRKKISNQDSLTLSAWLAVYLAFFWSRQVLNFLMSVPAIFRERTRYRSDEPNISLDLGLPHWVFGMGTGIIGAGLLIWVVFRIIPIKQRLTFLLAGMAGSLLGWLLWLETLGPALMP